MILLAIQCLKMVSRQLCNSHNNYQFSSIHDTHCEQDASVSVSLVLLSNESLSAVVAGAPSCVEVTILTRGGGEVL